MFAVFPIVLLQNAANFMTVQRDAASWPTYINFPFYFYGKNIFSCKMHQSKQLCLHQEMKSDKNKTFQHKKMNSKNKNFRIKKQETEIGKFCVSIKCYCFVYKKKMSKFSHNFGSKQ